MASSEASPLIESVVQQSATPNAPVITFRRRTILLLLLYLVFLDLGYELIVPAQTRVLERMYCRLYYEDHDSVIYSGDTNGGIDERLCKVGVIQSEVAMLKGWQITLDSIGSEFLAGLMSDSGKIRYGFMLLFWLMLDLSACIFCSMGARCGCSGSKTGLAVAHICIIREIRFCSARLFL